MLCKISQKMLFFRQAGHFRKNAPLLGSFSSAPQGTAGGGYILTQASICSETEFLEELNGVPSLTVDVATRGAVERGGLIGVQVVNRLSHDFVKID